MISISCYTLHPLIQRFVRLYRRVQVVSDWLTCIVTTLLCCHCLPPSPVSTSTSLTSPSIMSVKPRIDPERAGSGEPQPPQCVSIDFTPRPHDTDETAARCNQFWEMLKSEPKLEGIMVTSEKSPYKTEKECVSVHKNTSLSNEAGCRNSLPALKGVNLGHHKGAESRHG